MKRTIMMLLALVLVTGAVFGQTEADFTVTLTSDNEGVVITGYTGRVTAVRIPETIQGMPVREIRRISPDVFDRIRSTITSVVIPEGVTRIGNSAFQNCRQLAQITIPSTVTAIGERAFTDCSALRTVILPEGLTHLGALAFASSGLTSITLPGSLGSIGESIFSSCRSLTTVIIEEGITRIPDEAFANCNALTSVTMPSTITFIGHLAFSGCSALTNVTIPPEVERIQFLWDGRSGQAFMGASRLPLASQAALRRVGYEGGF